MKKSFFQSIITIFVLVFSVPFFSCDKVDDTVSTEPPTPACGPAQIFYLEKQPYEYTGVEKLIGPRRRFQFNVGSLGNVCLHNNQVVTWTVDYVPDPSREFTIRGRARWRDDDYGNYVSGTITPTSSGVHWKADALIDNFPEAFGEGPGSFNELRVDISFLSLGSELEDYNYFLSRFLGSEHVITVEVKYNKYEAP